MRLKDHTIDVRLSTLPTAYGESAVMRLLKQGSGTVVLGAVNSYVGASEINANPKDTKDYPKGVWTLPPTYAEGDKDKAKYQAIGESDRMTLRFRKPE